jgi:hypothetical protein
VTFAVEVGEVVDIEWHLVARPSAAIWSVCSTAKAQATPSPSTSSVKLLAMVGSPHGWYR